MAATNFYPAHFHPALARLRPGEFLKVEDGNGQRLAVFHGLVWVTQAGDSRDAFVAAGGSFTFDRPGLAVVEALKESRFAVLAAPADRKAANDEHAFA